MSRPLRIEYENAFYHIIVRGERRDTIFNCDQDKDKFLEKLNETNEKYQLLVHAYVLMDNHFHLLLETPLGNLSKGMHHLNASYGNWFRIKYQIVGSVFQGRYKAILVEKDEYFKILSAYIHLNPVRAGIVSEPSIYRYSSCAYYCNNIKPPAFLWTKDLIGLFNSRSEYGRFLIGFTKTGIEIGPDEIYGKNSLLGSDGFMKKAFSKLRAANQIIDEREQPDARNATKVDMDDILEIIMVDMRISDKSIWSQKRGNVYRKLLIWGLQRHTASNLKEIGKIMNMDYSAVSMLARRFEREMQTNRSYRRLAMQLAKEVMKRRLLKA